MQFQALGAKFRKRPAAAIGKKCLRCLPVFRIGNMCPTKSRSQRYRIGIPAGNGQTQLLVSVVDQGRTYGDAAFGTSTTPPPPIPGSDPSRPRRLWRNANRQYEQEFRVLDARLQRVLVTLWHRDQHSIRRNRVCKGLFEHFQCRRYFDFAWAKDYGFSPAVPVKAVLNYNPTAKTIVGTISSDDTGAVNFSGGPIPGSLYNYNTPALITTVAGTWTLSSLTGESIALNVTRDRHQLGTLPQCRASDVSSPDN